MRSPWNRERFEMPWGGGVHLDLFGDESRIQRLPVEFFAGMNGAINEEKLELTTDALQCGTDASEFLLDDSLPPPPSRYRCPYRHLAVLVSTQ